MKKMKENRAGSYVPLGFASEMIETIEDFDMGEEFAHGALCALSYLTCPEGHDMHGKTFEEFLDNFIKVADAMPPAEVESIVKKIVAQLEASGIEVVEARIVRGDR